MKSAPPSHESCFFSLSQNLGNEVNVEDIDSHYERPSSQTSIIISIALLIVIDITAFVGNILVLQVYWKCSCRPRASNDLPNSKRRGTKRSLPRLRFLQTNQRRLLVSLAIVDLITAAFVLPWDVLYKVMNLYDGNLYCNVSIRHFLGDLVNNLRNIMFALEGSILASIAIDRFVIIGGFRLLRSKCVFRRLRAGANTSETPQAQGSDKFELASVHFSRESPIRRAESSLEEVDSSDAAESFPTEDVEVELGDQKPTARSLPSSSDRWYKNSRLLCGEQHQSQVIIWIPILLTTLCVACIELTVFAGHVARFIERTDKDPTAFLRNHKDRVYLLLTIMSIPFLCRFYLCVFLAVRDQDVRSMKWRMTNSKGNKAATGTPADGPSRPAPRSLQTALTLFIATLVFYLTLLPVLIFHFYSWSSTETSNGSTAAADSASLFYAFHHEFYYINNAVNFFIYFMVSPAFRRSLKRL